MLGYDFLDGEDDQQAFAQAYVMTDSDSDSSGSSDSNSNSDSNSDSESKSGKSEKLAQVGVYSEESDDFPEFAQVYADADAEAQANIEFFKEFVGQLGMDGE